MVGDVSLTVKETEFIMKNKNQESDIEVQRKECRAGCNKSDMSIEFSPSSHGLSY
jgi:hypothetical protein